MFDNSRKFNYFLKFPLDFDLARAYNDFIVFGLLAQLVEQRTLNPWVAGSIPSQPIFISSSILSFADNIEDVFCLSVLLNLPKNIKSLLFLENLFILLKALVFW